MKRIVSAGLGVLALVGCERTPTLPVIAERQAFAVVGAGGSPVQEVSAGEGFSCALNVRGNAFCWGLNQFGSLGSGDMIDAATPRAVIGDVAFQALTTSGSHTCALAPGGAAYCWGANASA